MALGSEFDTIRRYFAPLSEAAVGAYGLGNDAAVWRPSDGCEAVITMDCMIAGVHFLPDDPPATVAAKLLAVNLSDLAAMGAKPAVYTVATAWPKDTDERWIAEFASGLAQAQAAGGVTLVGGDTVSTPGPMVLTLTAIGEVGSGMALPRGGAKAGDDVYVSGTIGDAALGLRILRGELSPGDKADGEYLIDRYRLPTARSALGAGLAGLASAAIDVSDGLVQDLGHIARESGVNIVINRDDIPLSRALNAALGEDQTLWDLVFAGGDDYELAFTAPPEATAEITGLANSTGTAATRIGAVEVPGAGGPEVRVLDADQQIVPVGRQGYRHF